MRLLILLLLVSCGKDLKNIKLAPPVPVNPIITFTGDSSNDPRLAGVALSIDTSKLNQEVPVQELLGNSVCQKALGNNNSVQDTGVTENHLIVESTDGGASGVIRFSHLAYYDSAGSDELCKLFSKESYNFTFDGNTLTIYAIAPGKSWDGAQSTFLLN